jgi:hypothetical protein
MSQLNPRKARGSVNYCNEKNPSFVTAAWWYPPTKRSEGQGQVYVEIEDATGEKVCIDVLLLKSRFRRTP